MLCYVVQELLGVMSRLESVSSFAVGSCGQKLLNCSKAAPDSFTSSASAIQAQLLPLTDAIVTSSSSSNDLTTLAFSASQDPGKPFSSSAHTISM